MAKKRKAAKKKAKKPIRKVAKKVSAKISARAKSGGRKSKAKPVPKGKSRRAAARVVEPSSGSASSSLDPRRAGRLRFNNVDESARRRRIGDLQGISMSDRADSESVGELLEEGQTLEAEAVAGVEDALDADQGEIRTREVPEDDVPEEYLDQNDVDRG
ncbi:MAG TPA: hypothetical protein VLC94_01160 [Candidatus Acidoferrum sp.]|nr:hypothetical protein [Candidatus Acidoferrum sp.]